MIIGQIHADDDEPLKVCYRKLPGYELGPIYFTHESRVVDGVYNVNNSGEPDEYTQATFYEIRNGHSGYAASE